MTLQKHVIIVGGTSPIGQACSALFGQAGHAVSIISSPSRQINGHKGRLVHHYKIDLRKLNSLPVLFEKIIKDQGYVSSLIFLQRFRGTTEKWAGEYTISVRATQVLIDVFSRQASKLDDRAIVITTSPACEKVATEQPISYHAMKAALSQIVRYYAVTLGHLNIRVNGVQPAIVLKPRAKHFYDNNPEILELYNQITPLGRPGTPVDIARVVSFLCSKDAGFVTGQILAVDGGVSLHESVSLALKASKLSHIPITVEATSLKNDK